MRTTKERFDEKWIPEPNSGCWLWLGGQTSRGYGAFGNEPQLAHRASHTLHIGQIPIGMLVCHKCDTPLCVNPDHLFLGTHRDNMADMAAKGRANGEPGNQASRLRPENQARGERHGLAKLTEADVREIRTADPVRWHELAKQKGVTRGLVSMVARRQLWKHVS